ncbi:MAG: yfgF [Rickettsiaceae bacterium]|jgi:EAL domain-containing protein (putative c-di-GMP-specific phosphodiesterase class I)|nr:yfgF [Rickettsiaceae bacterium]
MRLKEENSNGFNRKENINFSKTLRETIEECGQDKINKVLLKVHLANIDFLGLNVSSSEIESKLKDTYEIIFSVLRKNYLSESCFFKVGNDFYIILDDSKELLSNITFNIFKSLQINDVYTQDSFFDFKLTSIVFPKFGSTEEILLNKLRHAYQDQFSNGSAYHIVYDDETNNVIKRVETDYQRANILKRSISNNQIRFAFQPIVSCKTGHINHYECLLRMVDNNKLVSAGPLIPIAERLGFISIIDDMVIDMAIEELNRSSDINFAINISNLGVTNPYLLDKIKDCLSDSQLASRLIIEITETAAQDDLEKTKHFIKAVHKLGCKVAIDDFGAGYTSFRQLKLLPIDLIKIDGWFIRDVLDNLDNRFFVETLVKMAEELGTQTVAEFVENGEIAKFLLDIDVDYMQGNYFSPAVVNRSWVQNKKN